MDYAVINKEDLHRDGSNYEFEGYLYGDTNVSFIWLDLPPGEGPRLHRHPYAEVFIVQEGQATYTVGANVLEVAAGQVVIAPPNVPHKFTNSGTGRLRQVDIHLSKHFITEWLED
jgi:mannose-6-phosphate isomerase-like protein (cupin superfamily)